MLDSARLEVSFLKRLSLCTPSIRKMVQGEFEDGKFYLELILDEGTYTYAPQSLLLEPF